jgi:hypothetical protein
MPDDAARAQLDFSMPAAHAREPVDAIYDHRVPAAGYALNRNRIAAETRYETVTLLWSGWPTGDDRQRSNNQRRDFHAGSFGSIGHRETAESRLRTTQSVESVRGLSCFLARRRKYFYRQLERPLLLRIQRAHAHDLPRHFLTVLAEYR